MFPCTHAYTHLCTTCDPLLQAFLSFAFGSFETGSHVDLAGLEPAMWIRPLWDHVTLSTTCPRIWGGGAARASYMGWP